MFNPYGTNQRVELRRDSRDRPIGFYVQWVCRYRDELELELRPIGESSGRRVTLLDSGDFRYQVSADERAAVLEYMRRERAGFVEWCAKYGANPSDYPAHKALQWDSIKSTGPVAPLLLPMSA